MTMAFLGRQSDHPLPHSVLNPTDVCKVRLQVQNISSSNSSQAPPKYRSLTHTAARIYAEEGIAGLFVPGLFATVLRELCYSSLRFAFYAPIKTGLHSWIVDEETANNVQQGGEPFLIKLLSGLSSGILGSTLANPTDVVKIRLQSEAGRVVNGLYVSGLHEGQPPTYKNTLHAFYRIAVDEGFPGLYRGVMSTLLRAGAVTGVQLASYDETKYLLKKHNILQEGFSLHLTASVVAGVVTTTASAPIDFVKSRILSQSSAAPDRYTGVLNCMYRSVMVENKGNPAILFRGWLPSYLRLAPHFVIALPLNEWCRKMLGLNAL
ncbi:Mitochondrial oxaloacetate carrier protein [Dinochytrium kinnereticum]|nr:Mitochondrial oxaloacetate carrier protein [Dinochytrium kinnereticum]